MAWLRRRLIGIEGWRRYLLAFALGAVVTVSLPPFHAWPALVVGFTGLVWILDGCAGPRSACLAGWWFGFGYLGFGLYWIAFALTIEPERVGWMVPFAVLGLPAAFAVSGALATLTVHVSGARGIGRVVVLAGAWSAGEWLRGHAFTGFPWNLVGYGAAASDALLQVTAVIGVYGLGFLVVLASAMPATLAGEEGPASRLRRYGPVAAAAASIVVLWVGGVLRLAGADPGNSPGVTLRLVQANIAQDHKWREEHLRANLARHFRLSSLSGSDTVTHVVWPETAVPYFLAGNPRLSREVGRLANPGGLVITGAPRAATEKGDGETPSRIWNSVHAVDHAGRIVGTYDKSHLVPFGEYVPFRSLLRRLGIEGVASGQGDFQAGRGNTTLNLPGLPPVGILICYEAIFPGGVTSDAARPRWLLNVTNDAWFGRTAGPHQHFAMARVRAVEEGLPLVRVANTGISGVVDAHGRIVRKTALGETAVVDAPLPMPLDRSTLYARWGDSGLLAMLLAALIHAVAAGVRSLARRAR